MVKQEFIKVGKKKIKNSEISKEILSKLVKENISLKFNKLKGSASQLNKLVIYRNSVVLIFFPGLVINTYTNFQKTPAPSRVSNHSLFATTRCN